MDSNDKIEDTTPTELEGSNTIEEITAEELEEPIEWGILDSIPDNSEYKSFTERYFSKRYIINVDGIKNNDIMLMFHSNRIALLCLAPSHHFFQKKEDYTVNYNIGKIDRRDNAVKGKGKKGGQLLGVKSIVCKIQYKDGTGFNVLGCMKGKLIEVNESLVENPELLREMPDADGYIAVILSSIENSDTMKKDLLTPEQYLSSITQEGESNGDSTGNNNVTICNNGETTSSGDVTTANGD